MQEPRSVSFNTFKCMGDKSAAFIESSKAKLNLVFESRQKAKAQLEEIRAKSANDFVAASTEGGDLQAMYCQTFATERDALIEICEGVPALVDEANKIAQEREADCETAMATIKAEIAPFRFHFNNAQHETTFIRISGRYKDYEALATEARNYQKAANQLIQNCKKRVEWLDWKIESFKTSLLGPLLA